MARRVVAFYVVTRDQLAELHRARDVDALLVRLPRGPASFGGDYAKVAWALGYLDDEELAMPVEEEVTRDIGLRLWNAQFDVYDPRSVDLERIDVSAIDGEEYAREYFGGPLRDRGAIPELLAALQCVRDNLAATPAGSLLVIQT